MTDDTAPPHRPDPGRLDGQGPRGVGGPDREKATGSDHDLLTPTRVRALLDAHGLAPRKAHGQNFVIDPNTIRRTVREAGVVAGDLVVEIGPGLGSLTLGLRQAGAQVVAIEIDRGLAAALAGIVDEGVQVVTADALRVDYRALLDRPAKLVANLPYNVATPLVMTTLRSGCFTALHVMVQREVGERWCARVGDPAYGAVSVKIAALARARIISAVSRTAFWPVPRVDSVTVALDVHGASQRQTGPSSAAPAGDALFRLVDAGFAQRRKRLRNALSGAGVAPQRTEAALAAAGLDPAARAEQLSLDDWCRLQGVLDQGPAGSR